MTPWTPACQASLSFTISWNLLKLMCMESVIPSNHLIFCCPLLLLPLNLSQLQGLFQWVCSSHQVAKVLSFSFSISPSYEYSGLISFRIDWFDLLAVQGTLKSLLQYHSSKASVFWCSGFFMVQLSTQLILHPACIWVYTELTQWHPESKLHSNLRDLLSIFSLLERLRRKPSICNDLCQAL